MSVWKTPRVALFGKRKPVPAQHPISAFWDWWAAEGNRIDPPTASGFADDLTRRVKAMHEDLAWHMGPGDAARYGLIVSAGGIAEARPVAERWLRAAPAEDATWEFRSSQWAEPEALTQILEMAGNRVNLADTQFRVESSPEEFRVHVGVYHPAFPDLPEPARAQITYLVLDWLLGEDDVERWLGHIEPLTDPPVPAVSASDVVAAVAEIAAQRDPDGWSLAQWEDEGGAPGMALFRRGLRWIDYPILDRHQIVSVQYDAQSNGLPADAAALDGLRQIESELEALLGQRGILIAHETNRGVRTFHAYTDGEDQNIDAAVTDWASGRTVSLESRPDPAWLQVRHFTG